MKSSNIISVRSSALLILEIALANPNGDPDMSGRPRMFGDGRGWMSDVSVKRKWRDMFERQDSAAFIDLQKEFGFNPERFRIFESLGRGITSEPTPEEAVKNLDMVREMAEKNPDKFLDTFGDVRLFGTTALEEKQEAPKEEGAEETPKAKKKEKSKDAPAQRRFVRSGVVTMRPAISILPIVCNEDSTTRKASSRNEILRKGAGDMAPGAKRFVQHGIYVMPLTVNPNLAHLTKTTVEDIEIFKASLKHIFEVSESVTRPAGSVRFAHIWWKNHKNSLCSFNEYEFFQSLMPKKVRGPEGESRFEYYDFPKPSGPSEGAIDLAA